MPIAFFITEYGEFYADMEITSLDQETYQWLSGKRIDLGRKAAFTVSRESPIFDAASDAADWLEKNWFSDSFRDKEQQDAIVDSSAEPAKEDYEECASLAVEINEVAAMGKLADILPNANDHSFLCSVGNWYWSLRHGTLAKMAYERSIEIRPEAPTFLNLAVCCDDLGLKEPAQIAMTEFYQRVSSYEEQVQAEAMLRDNGKGHLVRS